MDNGSFFSIMNDVDYCLIGSIGQIASDAQALNLWSTSSMNKTNAWLNGTNPDGSEIDPELYQALEDAKNGTPDPDMGNTPQSVSAWFTTNFPGGPGTLAPNGIDSWSINLIVLFQQVVTSFSSASSGSGGSGSSSSSDQWNALIGSVGSANGMVSSAMTQDTTTGSTESQNMQSQLNTDNSALQPIADFGSTNSQNIGTISNILAQMSPA